MEKPQLLQKMLGHLAFWIRLTAHLPLINVDFTDFTFSMFADSTVSMLVQWFYCSLPLKFIETTRFEDDKIKNLWQKACWKCDLEQSLGTHKRQQNKVFETKGLWEMWHEQILGTCTRQWKKAEMPSHWKLDYQKSKCWWCT